MAYNFYYLITLSVIFLKQYNMDGFFYKNFNYKKELSFRLNQSFSSSFTILSNISISDKIQCLAECYLTSQCLTVEIKTKMDNSVECNLLINIPNFYSFDVVQSNDTQIYVKGTTKQSFNKGCFYDNCFQEKGLSCVNGNCMCKNENEYGRNCNVK